MDYGNVNYGGDYQGGQGATNEIMREERRRLEDQEDLASYRAYQGQQPQGYQTQTDTGLLSSDYPRAGQQYPQQQQQGGSLYNQSDDTIERYPQMTGVQTQMQTGVPITQGGAYNTSSSSSDSDRDVSTGITGYGYGVNLKQGTGTGDYYGTQGSNQPENKSIVARAKEYTQEVVGGVKKGLDKVLPGHKVAAEETTRVYHDPQGVNVVERTVRHR